MAKPSKPASLASKTTAARFRPQIEAAIAAGVASDTLTLRLTRRDVYLLVRDPAVALAEIHYDDGAMFFLGVRVEKGGVEVSQLDRPLEPSPASEAALSAG